MAISLLAEPSLYSGGGMLETTEERIRLLKLSRGVKMIFKEDCTDFRYLKNEITETEEGQRRFMNIPNCRINKMSLCGCSETCSYYKFATIIS